MTLISTVLNEEKSMEKYMKSIFSQSRLPDEIIIVDGGSTDNTVDVIRKFCDQGVELNILVRKGINIAKGRNIAISKSSGEIIVATDAGCRLDMNWLMNITKPFVEKFNEVDVVSGYYKGEPRNLFEECISVFTMPTEQDFNIYNPSSRSIAFKKSAWKLVGGYPEWLYTGEDSLFNVKLKKAKLNFQFVPSAVVFWRPRKKVSTLFKQYYLYAIGDRRANLIKGHYVEKFDKYLMLFIILFCSIYYINFVCGILFIYLLCSYWSGSVKYFV